jgi:hypothetical protein
MLHKSKFLSHFLSVLFIFGSIGLIGCDSGLLPGAPDLSSDISATGSMGAPAASLRLAVSPFSLQKSAGAKSASKIKTRRIGERGGRIGIVHENTRAIFEVPRGALEQSVDIRMQLKGSGASTVVEFGPDGLQFAQAAILALTFSTESIDPENLGGYLVEADGQYTPVPYSTLIQDDRVTLFIEVMHFSEYTGDGGDPPE